MENGGKRPGAGRKKGSSIGYGLSFRDYWTPAEIHEFVQIVKETCKKDPRLMVHVTERLFGKVPQPVQGTGDNGEIIIKLVSYADCNNSV